jgi:hypothetical protein
MTLQQTALDAMLERGLVIAKRAIVHPVGLAVLSVTLGFAVAVALLPQLYPWRANVGWLLLWGFLAYLATALAASSLPSAPPPPQPELRDLLRVRGHIASRLRRMSRAGERRPELESVLRDALRQIDNDITPDMRRLLERQAALSDYLDRVHRRALPVPDQPYLDRVEAIRERQRITINTCVQAGANALATLVAVLEQGDSAVTSQRARAWAEDLDVLHDAIVEVIRDEGEPPRPVVDAAARVLERGEREDYADRRESAGLHTVEEADPTTKLDALLVGTALRRLNNSALLAESELIRHLPHLVLDALHAQGRNGTSADPSPVERAQALRKVLCDGIERLKPEDDSSVNPGSMQYRILRQEYVEGHPTKWLEARFAISESTLHRHRKAALRLLARDLLKQEERVPALDTPR